MDIARYNEGVALCATTPETHSNTHCNTHSHSHCITLQQLLQHTAILACTRNPLRKHMHMSDLSQIRQRVRLFFRGGRIPHTFTYAHVHMFLAQIRHTYAHVDLAQIRHVHMYIFVCLCECVCRRVGWQFCVSVGVCLLEIGEWGSNPTCAYVHVNMCKCGYSTPPQKSRTRRRDHCLPPPPPFCVFVHVCLSENGVAILCVCGGVFVGEWGGNFVCLWMCVWGGEGYLLLELE